MRAADDGQRLLASELLIAQGDLARLADPTLSTANRRGLQARLAGSMGVLPWMLRKAGDVEGASELSGWLEIPLTDAKAEHALVALLSKLTERHGLDTVGLDLKRTAATAREARAIHETYCAGCHDQAENGDPDLELPARDLFLMARQEADVTFLGRLITGIKGDETIGFRNPLTDSQLYALWMLYLHESPMD
ncbi:hypothetical protein [Marimonas lutisalis]|uniref:hypothetical protein n=1 Tax=Marimonas lutisalis TaxID=2545756 RepID=UPI0010F4F46F|nr:hypothetical protein [Marimonas lutisalis]